MTDGEMGGGEVVDSGAADTGGGGEATPTAEGSYGGGDDGGSTGATEGGAADGDGGGGESAEPAVRYKYRHGGEDQEGTMEDIQGLLDQLGDSHEHTFQANGQEVRATNADLREHYQLRQASYDGMRKNKEAQAAFEAEIEAGKSDPFSFMAQRFGVNMNELARGRTKQIIDLNMLKEADPDSYIRGTQQMQEQERQAKERFVASQRQAMERKQAVAASKKAFFDAVPKHLEAAGLPYSKLNETMMVNHMREASQAGREGFSPEQAAQYVAKDLRGMVHSQLGGMDGAALLKYLPPAVVDAIRAQQVAAITGKDPIAAKPKPAKPKPAAAAAESISAGDWLNSRG